MNPVLYNHPAPEDGRQPPDVAENLADSSIAPTANRRDFLRSLVVRAGLVTEASLLASGPAHSTFFIAQAILEGKDHNAGALPEAGPYPYTDTQFHRADGSIVRNIGVMHSAEGYASFSAHYEEAIRDADIILMERWPRLDPDDDFFGPLALYAKELGKSVILIDDPVYATKASIAMGAQFPLAAAGLLQIKKDWSKSPDDEDSPCFDEHSPYFTVPRIAAWMSSLLIFPNLPIIASYHTDKRYTPADLSYVGDGRTVKMWENASAAFDEQPGKRFLCITGDLHAQGFEYYRKHSWSHSIRKAVYNWTYFLVGKGRPAELD